MTPEERRERLELRKREVGIQIDRVTDVTSTDYPGHYPEEDNPWNLDKFRDQLFVQIFKADSQIAEFDLVGIDASIANAIRRILIAEIPTMAIEYVYIMNNTSVIQDEVLAHRLGLIPIFAPAEKFLQFQRPPEGEQPTPTDRNTIVLELKIKCERNPTPASDEPKDLYINGNVWSKDITWVPMGTQEAVLADVLESGRRIGPVQDDILVAKLRPGQELEIQMHAILGVGQDHAKFSPVAPASYRILPTITILQPIEGKDADKFKHCFPTGVIDVVQDSKAEGGRKAVVVNARDDSVSRECLRHDEFKDKVRLGRRRDHFIFSVESSGVAEPDDLVMRSIAILRRKCEVIKHEIEKQRGDTVSEDEQ